MLASMRNARLPASIVAILIGANSIIPKSQFESFQGGLSGTGAARSLDGRKGLVWHGRKASLRPGNGESLSGSDPVVLRLREERGL